jgi:hypothetical protein
MCSILTATSFSSGAQIPNPGAGIALKDEPDGPVKTGDVSSGSERARAFLPSKDFEASKAFYVLLGFTLALEGDDVAIFATGESEFLLTPFYQGGRPRTS